MPAARADALIRGEDEIGATLRCQADIDTYLAEERISQPWLYPPAGGNIA